MQGNKRVWVAACEAPAPAATLLPMWLLPPAQRQLSSALERLDEHSNTAYTLERRVRQEPIIARPHTMAARIRGGSIRPGREWLVVVCPGPMGMSPMVAGKPDSRRQIVS